MPQLPWYQDECVLLRAVARVICLETVATTTALYFLHKCRTHSVGCSLSTQDLVGGCIWVAAKAEEVSCSSNQLINTLALLSSPQGRHLLDTLAPQPPLGNPSCSAAGGAAGQLDLGTPAGSLPAAAAAGSSAPTAAPASAAAAAAQGSKAPKAAAAWDGSHEDSAKPAPPPPPPPAAAAAAAPLQEAVLVGDAYYAAKARLLAAEQAILRLLRFQLLTPRPHSYLLNLARLTGASQACAAAAVCLVNDACVFTRLLLEQPPQVLAVASMQLALRLLQQHPAAPLPEALRRQVEGELEVNGQVEEQQIQQRQQQQHEGLVQDQVGWQEARQEALAAELEQDYIGPKTLQAVEVQQQQEEQQQQQGQPQEQQQQERDKGGPMGESSAEALGRGPASGPVSAHDIVADPLPQAEAHGAQLQQGLAPNMAWVAALDIDQEAVAGATQLLNSLVLQAWAA